MRVALLHGYSAENSGDGLLVRMAIDLIREALGTPAITLFASYPESFADLGVPVLRTKPGRRGYGAAYVGEIRSDLARYDLVVGVGGGYLRAPRGRQNLKTALVMLPQLRAAARCAAPTVYLPQSIGPLRGAVGRAIRRNLGAIDAVYVRDERSARELEHLAVVRAPDVAILCMRDRRANDHVDPIPVLNVRAFRGEIVPASVADLRSELGTVDGFVQSSVASNTDRPSVLAIEPNRIVERAELYEDPAGASRVLAAMRLHCALEAIGAGHYVVHLAYERKGFGAFHDLGLGEYVHNVRDFDVAAVVGQVRSLLTDDLARRDYDERARRAVGRANLARHELVTRMRQLAAR